MEVCHFGFKSYKSYLTLSQMCKSRNFLDWMSDLEDTLKVKGISRHLTSIAIANNVVIEHVQDYAAREIANASTCKNDYLSVTFAFLTSLKFNKRYFEETPP